MKGSFIAFEGIDGSGKSTQLELLASWARSRGLEVLVVREPGGTAVGERIREILLDEQLAGLTDQTEALLYAASRAQLVRERIAPALAAGTLVLADRFWGSTLAYQGFGRGLPLEMLRMVTGMAVGDVLPDHTFLLRLDQAAAVTRRAHQRPDRIEQAGHAFFERVINGYDELAASDPSWTVVDAGATPEQIAAAVAARMEQLVAVSA